MVEADETYAGGKAANRKGKVPPKEAAFALVERDGSVRSFHVAAVDAATLRPILRAHVDRHSYLMTSLAPTYIPMGRDFAGHGAVNHSIEEYVRGSFWHTNTIENYCSILKRGIVGTFHHVSQQHLVDRIERLVPAACGGDDAIGVGGPGEWLCAVVVFGQITVDRGLQVDERMKDAAFEPAAGELGKEPLDSVEPGRRGRGEVERPARMAGQPSSDFGVLVAAVIVEDDVDQPSGGMSRSRRLRKRRNS